MSLFEKLSLAEVRLDHLPRRVLIGAMGRRSFSAVSPQRRIRVPKAWLQNGLYGSPLGSRVPIPVLPHRRAELSRLRIERFIA